MLLDIDKVFYIALGLFALMLIMIMLKIVLDIKRSAKTRAEYFEMKMLEFYEKDLHLCSYCKLHRWFMIGVDGEVVIKVPGKIEVHEETLTFKGKVPE